MHHSLVGYCAIDYIQTIFVPNIHSTILLLELVYSLANFTFPTDGAGIVVRVRPEVVEKQDLTFSTLRVFTVL